jgi:hypothetical protein
VQNADPRRAVRLVAGPGVEVSVDRPQIDRDLGDCLTPVDEHLRAGVMGALNDVGDRIDRADDVRDVRDREQLRRTLEQRVERVKVELAVVEHRHVREFGTPVRSEQLPRNDVRVVLHLGEHDQVTGADVLSTPRVRNEVDRRRGVRGEDRLLRRRAEPFGDPAARALEQIRRLHREGIDPTVDRRARLGVVPRHRVDHRLRRL